MQTLRESSTHCDKKVKQLNESDSYSIITGSCQIASRVSQLDHIGLDKLASPRARPSLLSMPVRYFAAFYDALAFHSSGLIPEDALPTNHQK